jgi:acyl carrier protein
VNEEEITAEIERQILKLMPDLDTPITPSTKFEDLGLDSLTRVDLLAATEGVFGIEVPDESVASIIEVKDLTDMVLSSRAAV